MKTLINKKIQKNDILKNMLFSTITSTTSRIALTPICNSLLKRPYKNWNLYIMSQESSLEVYQFGDHPKPGGIEENKSRQKHFALKRLSYLFLSFCETPG
jgi:hypothetical protein